MIANTLRPFASGDFAFSENQIRSVCSLIEEGATVPFIARYRKERTGNIDELGIQKIWDAVQKKKAFDERKKYVLDAIQDQGQLSDQLRKQIETCLDPNLLEDLYLPFKKRRATKADKAIKWGLEGLAKMIMAQRDSRVEQVAAQYLNANVTTIDQAIEGAMWIIAEWINQDVQLREQLREQFLEHAVITSSVKKGKTDEGSKYRNFFDHSERIKKCPSYRLLAMLRGEAEGFLNVKIRPDEDRAIYNIRRRKIKNHSSTAFIIEEACADAYKRLLAPSLETWTKAHYKDKADLQAIEVFAKNAEQLLMAPPLSEKRILAIDPGFRTGCKMVILGINGSLIKDAVIYPHPPQNQHVQALSQIHDACAEHQIEAIAIGDATAGRETWEWLQNSSSSLPPLYLVDESGASIYSASDIARQEFPHHDITVRGAVSIGRRLMDPLAELIKIDPKSIGVGEYQHDVHQGKLQKRLDDVVETVVNRVGAQLNTASPTLLAHIAGLGPSLANNIVSYRNQNGPFQNIKELKKVPRLGNKAFEQCSGFLRIRNGKNILDNTGVHPESYHVVEKMAKSVGISVKELVGNKDALGALSKTDFVDSKIGMLTIDDILKELSKPGLDIRGEMSSVVYDQKVRTLEDLKEGMILDGQVKNITGFGAFIDLGIKENGLVHISQITNSFIEHPSEVLSLRQKVRVKVVGLDMERRRIQLSMKELT